MNSVYRSLDKYVLPTAEVSLQGLLESDRVFASYFRWTSILVSHPAVLTWRYEESRLG